MRASHTIAGIVGFLGCFGLWVTSSFIFGALGADAHDNASSVWIYTPHVKPGDTMRTKIRVSTGEACGIETMTASIDGAVVAEGGGPGRTWGGLITRTSSSTPSSERELSIPIPDTVPPGKHQLEVKVTYAFADSGPDGFKNSEGTSELTTRIDIESSTIVGRLASLLRALAPAFLVFLLTRRVYPKVRAWVSDAEAKSAGAFLGSFFIALGVSYCGAGYPLFALPLAAAAGTPDYLVILSMIAWILLPIVTLVFWRKKAALPLVLMTVRFVDAPEAASNAAGYRDGRPKDPPRRSFATIAEALWYLKLRRRAGGYTSGRFAPVRAEVEVANPDDIGASFTLRTPWETLLRAATHIAAAEGPIDVEVGNTRMRIEASTSIAALRSTLCP